MATKKRFGLLTQCLAALAVVLVYSIGLIGSSLFVSAATATSAEARGGGRGGGGRGRGGGRGWARGRGRGWGPGIYIAPPVVRGCYWSRRYGRTICPY